MSNSSTFYNETLIDWVELPKPLTIVDFMSDFEGILPCGMLIKVQINMEILRGLQLKTATEEKVWLVGDRTTNGYSGCSIRDFTTKILAYSVSLCNLVTTMKHTTDTAPPTPWRIEEKSRRRPLLDPEVEAIKKENMLDRSEVHELELLLEDIPPDNAIERLGLEERIKTIKNNIAERTQAYVKKTFY